MQLRKRKRDMVSEEKQYICNVLLEMVKQAKSKCTWILELALFFSLIRAGYMIWVFGDRTNQGDLLNTMAWDYPSYS